jgi:hypothetical protein
MPRKLTAAEHLQSYLADTAAGKLAAGGRRRISYDDGLYFYITGPRSCRRRYDYRHRGTLDLRLLAVGEAALGDKETKRNAASFGSPITKSAKRLYRLAGRRADGRALDLPAKPVHVLLTAGWATPTAPAPGAIMTFRQAWKR